MNDKQSQHVYGFHAVTALLTNSPDQISEIFLLKGRKDKRLQKIQELVDQHQLKNQHVTREQLDEKVAGNHQGVVAIKHTGTAQVYDEAFLKSRLLKKIEQQQLPFLLILDGVTDPHNLGACLRSAEAAGVDAVIVPKDKSVSLTPTVIKVACGAAELVPLVRVTNLVRTLEWLKQQGVWVLGAAGEAQQPYYQADFTVALALVMGSEGKGLRRLTREHCDELLAIPMIGETSSLNVSVATGVCLFEVVRQRNMSVNNN